VTGFADLLRRALATGDDAELRTVLVRGGADARSVGAFARAVGSLVSEPDPPVAALEALLDGWAGDASAEVVLPCAAVAAYGEVGAVRPDWWDDEIGKLRRAAADDRRSVREAVVLALQRLLTADHDRAAGALRKWAADPDPRVVEVAATAVGRG
jgi:hypothetical protein